MTMRPLVLSLAAFFLIAPRTLHGDVIELTKEVDHSTVHYKVVLPNGYDPAKAYPAILALGGGPQTMNSRYHPVAQLPRGGREARYIVIAPAASERGAVFPGWRSHLSGLSGSDSQGLQDSGRQVSYRDRPTAGLRRFIWQRPLRMLPQRDRLPRIHVGAHDRQAAGDLNMCVSCMSANTTSMWHDEMAEEVRFLRPRDRRPLYRRKGQPHGLATLAAPTPRGSSMASRRPSRAAAASVASTTAAPSSSIRLVALASMLGRRSG